MSVGLATHTTPSARGATVRYASSNVWIAHIFLSLYQYKVRRTHQTLLALTIELVKFKLHFLTSIRKKIRAFAFLDKNASAVFVLKEVNDSMFDMM